MGSNLNLSLFLIYLTGGVHFSSFQFISVQFGPVQFSRTIKRVKFKVESRLGEKRWMQDWVRGRGGILPASGQVSVHAASAASEPGIGPVKLAASVFPVERTMSFTSTWYLHHMASSKKLQNKHRVSA